jgi:hypothetical protein
VLNPTFLVLQCHSKCTEINATLLGELGFDVPGGAIEILSGSNLNLTCTDSEFFVTDSWTSNVFQLECMHSGEFKTYEL